MIRHIHITGAARSGTTLLMELMRSCYEWDWAPENETPVAGAVEQRSGRSLSKSPTGGIDLRAFLLHPESWLLFCQRDPRDVVCSRHKNKPEVYWSNLMMWKWMYRNQIRLQGHPRVMIIRYESLVEEPDRIQREIEKALPWLQRRCLFSEYHTRANPSRQSKVALHGVRPINRKSVGLWKSNLERLAGQLQLHGPLSPILIETGYETDDQWLELLKGVEPDIEPGFWPDSVSKYNLIRLRIRQFRTAFKIVSTLAREKMGWRRPGV